MAARGTTAIVLASAVMAIIFCSGISGSSSFVSPPGNSAAKLESATLRGGMQSAGAAAAYGSLVAGVPMPAEAATEQELNRFGLIFIVIWTGLFFAAFARLFTIGKL